MYYLFRKVNVTVWLTNLSHKFKFKFKEMKLLQSKITNTVYMQINGMILNLVKAGDINVKNLKQ